MSAKISMPTEMFLLKCSFIVSNLRQNLLGGDQSSNLLLRVNSKTRVVSPEITSVVGVLCNVVSQGILGDKGLGLTTK